MSRSNDSQSRSDITDSGVSDRCSVTNVVSKNESEYCGIGESGDSALNSLTEASESAEDVLMRNSDSNGSYSVSEMSEPREKDDIDPGEDDLYLPIVDSYIVGANSGTGESGDSCLCSFTDPADSGDEGLSSVAMRINSVRAYSISESTDSGDVDLCPVLKFGSKNESEYCGMGESGDNALNSLSDATDSGEEHLISVIIMAESGDIGMYSGIESGERDLSSSSDVIDSGDSGLCSNSWSSENNGAYSSSDI